MDSHTESWLARLLAPEQLSPSEQISPRDAMYVGNMAHYLGVGRSALQSIGKVMLAAGSHEPARILDLPSGHGRVMRVLRAAFPGADITACDLDPSAVEYCERMFGATGVVATLETSQIRLPGSYDLIWCGSLLTHLPLRKWTAFLQLFERALAPGGVLVFTTHGRKVLEWLRNGATENGSTMQQMYGLTPSRAAEWYSSAAGGEFRYIDYPEQSGYGLSLSPSPIVVDLVQRVTSLRVVATEEHGWDDHQDVIGCVKD